MILTLLTPAPAWARSLPPSPMLSSFSGRSPPLHSLDLRGAARLLLSKLHLLAGDWRGLIPRVCPDDRGGMSSRPHLETDRAAVSRFL
ncbi:unnamed protein product, partial [Staurois parvus]